MWVQEELSKHVNELEELKCLSLRIKGGTIQDTDPVENLGLSNRALGALNRASIRTVAELCAKSPKELLKYRTFGARTLRELMFAVSRYGRSLKADY